MPEQRRAGQLFIFIRLICVRVLCKRGLFTKWRRSGSAGHFCTRVYAGCMAGCVLPRKTHLRRANFCSFCLNMLWGDTYRWYLCSKNLKNQAREKESAQDFSIFQIDDKWAVWDSEQHTTLQIGLYSDPDCGCQRQATPSLGFCFPDRKGFRPHLAFWLFWFCVCGYWLLSPSYGHLVSAKSGKLEWLATVHVVYNGKSSETAADVQLSIVRLSNLTKRKSSWRLKTHWDPAIVVPPRASKSVRFFQNTCIRLRSTVTTDDRVLSDLCPIS